MNPTIDETGVYAILLNYTIVFFFVGGALILFVYLWWKGRLDLDEKPKYDMMKSDEEREKEIDEQKRNK